MYHYAAPDLVRDLVKTYLVTAYTEMAEGVKAAEKGLRNLTPVSTTIPLG